MKNSILLTGIGFLFLTFLLHSCKKEELPTLSTSAISNLTATSASGGGNITSDGGAEIIARGVCWGVNVNPETSGSRTNDGTGAGQFTSNFTGLSAGTTYHVRAYAANSVGTAYGDDITFTTLGKIPEAITQPATNITSSGATLNGTVNAHYLSTSVTFEYGVTTSYGQSLTATQSPVTGNSITNVSADITGLTAGTTYHFRIKTVNSLGTAYGSDMELTPVGQVPTTITQGATNISTITATLNGTVNPNYLPTTVTFEYGTSTSYGQTITAVQSPVTGNNIVSVGAEVTGLLPGTTYHFRVKAVNSIGTTFGSDLIFPTLGHAPSVTTLDATNKSISGATLNGIVNANSLPTTVIFEYGTTSSYGEIVNATPSSVTGNTITNVSANISGLISTTIYHFRAKAVNSLGTTYGSDLTFTTSGQAPTATTQPASAIQSTSATLNGIVNANYASTTITFEYGTAISYGSSVEASPSPATGNTNTNVSAVISGLIAGTTYHFRIKAVSSLGTTYGDDMTFPTSGQAPTATTQPASAIQSTSATLNGIVNANYATTTITFEYGTAISYGSSVEASPSPVTGNTNTNVSAVISGLIAGTTYHFRIKAVSSIGTTYGSDVIFIIQADKKVINPFIQPNDSTLNWYGSGDVVQDNVVNNMDLSRLVELVNGSFSNPNDKRLRDRADVNGDSYVNIQDKTLLESFLNGSINHLPGYWNQLTSRLERESWLDKMIKIDKTNETYFPGGDCTEFSSQFLINFHGYNSNEISNFLSAFPHDISNNGRFNIPIFRASITFYDSNGNPEATGHDMNTVVLGNNAFIWNDLCNIEPQVDAINVQPGQYYLKGTNSLFDVGGSPIKILGNNPVQMTWYVSYRIKDYIPTRTSYESWEVKFINLRNK